MIGLGRLYLKELREHRFLLAGTIGAIACLYGYILIGVKGEVSTLLLASFPGLTTTAVLTFGLISAFWGEWKGSTHYLLLSLPVSRVAIPLSKYLSILTAGTIVYLTAILSILSLNVPLAASTQILKQLQLDPKTLMIFLCTEWFALLVLLLGVVVACVSLRYAITKARSSIIGSFLILLFICYWYFLGDFSELMGEEIGFFRSQIIYTFLFGLVNTIAGLVLFHKRAEI